MDLNTYQNLARQTAIYPGKDGVRIGDLTGLTYTILGLIGEAAEYSQNSSLAEKGDCFWYISQIAYEIQIPLGHLSDFNPENASYNDLFACAGTLANQYKKVFRDDNGALTTKRREVLIKILKESLWHLTKRSDDNVEAMEKNIEKLSSRQAKGVIAGEGDFR